MSATLTPPPAALPLPRERPALREPLQRLDRRIRRYVFLEGLAWAGLALAAFCLCSFFFDWGVLFRLFGIDYLKDGLVAGHRAARVLALLGLVGGLLLILAYHWGYRLFARFQPVDLALVLERRFPKLLGDRLITTLELGDPAKTQKIDLSWPLVESTADEATSRLKDVNLDAVFNRRRLLRLGLWAGTLLLACILVGYLNTDAALTWADRNLLLRDAFWPQPILLRIEGFDAERTKAVPFGSELRVELKGAKWVVATNENAEGWRPIEWLRDLLPGGEAQRAWELEGTIVSPRLFAVLPPSWQKLTLDDVNARVEPANAFEPYRREVGLAAIRYLRKEAQANVPQELADLLTPALLGSTPEERDALLALAQRLAPGEAEQLAARLLAARPLPWDLQAQAAFLGTPWPVPLPPLSALQTTASARNAATPLFAVAPVEAARLPKEWLTLPAKEIVERLQRLAKEESPEALGDRVRGRLEKLFSELEQRADQTHWGRRRTFRRLVVPPKIVVEFEQRLEGDERGRVRPRRGLPEVKRHEGDYAYSYDFKKIEQPLRFRALAGSTSTQWYDIAVRPLPALKRLDRYQDEPGYLHGSLRRVHTGPYPMSLDGQELRGEAPAGSRLRLEGESYKPLKSVRVVGDNPIDPAPGTVVHEAGKPTFTLLLRPLGKEPLRFQLELIDTDGIAAGRQVLLASLADREPEFQRAAFEVVNRKMITAQALLPLTATLRDDHGLSEAAYEVIVEKPDRTVLFTTRIPLRRFSPVQFIQPQVRFDKPAEVKMGPLNALASPLFTSTSAMLRLPQAGIPLLVPPPAVGPTTEFTCGYTDPNLTGPVLRPDQEFLDLLLLRVAAGKPVDSFPWPVPCRLVIRLVAKDSRRDETEQNLPAGQESPKLEAFDFQVVSEQELLIEVGKREEELRDRCEEVLTNLKKLKNQVKKLHDDFPTYGAPEFQRSASDMADLQKGLAVARAQADEQVLRDFRQVYRELALNRVNVKVLERVDGKICVPLYQLLQPGNLFSQSADSLETLARRLEAEQENTPRAFILESGVPLDRLIQRLEDIMNEMRKLIEFNQALQALRDLIKAMDGNVKAIEEWRKKKQKEELEP